MRAGEGVVWEKWESQKTIESHRASSLSICEVWRPGTATFWLHVSSEIPNSCSFTGPPQDFLLDVLLETGFQVAQVGFQPHYRTRDDLELRLLLDLPGIREACHHT